MGKKKFGKKVLAGIMSLALAASILPAGAMLQETQMPVALAAGGSGTYDGFWADYAHTKAATGGSIVAYVNGNKDYKTSTVYTDITPSYIYEEKQDSKGKITLKSSTSKVLVATSTSDSDSPFTEKGDKVDSNDEGVKTASKIAKATIKNGVVTVTAQKEAGEVYVWVNDTNPKVDPVTIPATIKMAPKKIEMYKTPIKKDEDATATGVTAVTKGDVNIVSNDGMYDNALFLYLYAYNTTGTGSSKAKEGVFKDITFTATLDSKSAGYFTIVREDSRDPYVYRLKALKTATDSKGNVKPFTGKVTFTCDQSGAKTTFSATAVDHVNDFGWKVQDASSKLVKYTPSSSEKKTFAKAELVATASKSAVTAKLDVDITACISKGTKTTDKVAVKEITSSQATEIMNAGKFETDKYGLPKYAAPSPKSGITASLSNGVLTLKVAKGKALGTKGYFIVGYAGGAFDIIEAVTVEKPSEDAASSEPQS